MTTNKTSDNKAREEIKTQVRISSQKARTRAKQMAEKAQKFQKSVKELS